MDVVITGGISVASIAVSSKVGAAIGTAVCPGVGTAIGAVAGATVSFIGWLLFDCFGWRDDVKELVS